MTSISLQPAYLLHRRPYRESSQLLELLTPDHGRIGAVARGLQRRARGGTLGSLLQPFVPLLVSCRGRGELATLTSAELAGAALPLQGVALYSALYVNELLIRLLERGEAHPALFAHYGAVLAALAESAAVDRPLREFELALLDELGYRVDFLHEAGTGRALSPSQRYRYVADHGLQPARATDPAGSPGSDLIAFAGGDSSAAAMDAAKKVTREAISILLGGRPLRSRELFRRGVPAAVQAEAP
jgi:DNA repair protein RecO (recombination protein O)